MRIIEGIIVMVIVVVCAIGVGGGVAFFILTLMGFFKPLIGG